MPFAYKRSDVTNPIDAAFMEQAEAQGCFCRLLALTPLRQVGRILARVDTPTCPKHHPTEVFAASAVATVTKPVTAAVPTDPD